MLTTTCFPTTVELPATILFVRSFAKWVFGITLKTYLEIAHRSGKKLGCLILLTLLTWNAVSDNSHLARSRLYLAEKRSTLIDNKGNYEHETKII